MSGNRTEQPDSTIAALYAAALNLLLAGLVSDGADVAIEIDRILAAGPQVAGPVLGFMTAAARGFYEHEHAGRDTAIVFVERELAAVLSEIPNSAEPT